MFFRLSKNSPHSSMVTPRSTARATSGEKTPSSVPSMLAPRLSSSDAVADVCASDATASWSGDNLGYEKNADGSVEVVNSCVKSSRLRACDDTLFSHSYAHAER
jgi:hypothetical protein